MKNKLTLSVMVLSLLVLSNSAFLPPVGDVHSGGKGFREVSVNGTGDEKIFDNTIWWIVKSNGPIVQSPMQVYVNNQDKGTAYLLKFGHRSGAVWPEIAAIYNTGYVRLAPFGLPYGTSFVLGPAHWDSNQNYAHVIQISRIDIKTPTGTSDGPIELKIYARDFLSSRWPDYHMDITYQVTLPIPAADLTQMIVKESFTVAKSFSLSPSRQASHEGFKWLQFSSMYIDSTYHDSDGALYVDRDENIQVVNFSEVGCNTIVFPTHQGISSVTPWVEVLHRDDASWQGNTPNTIFQLNTVSLAAQTTMQGYIECTADPNDDNVGVWLNNDAAPTLFNVGDAGSIDYTLIAQDDPREPPTTFSDVRWSYWAWQYIESLFNASITGGCATNPLQYCPESSVTRAQMAVFLLRAKHGASYRPPAVSSSTGFGDVPTTHWAGAWIKQLAAEKITGGCGSGNYCPESTVTRAQMAIFLLKAKHGSTYSPPSVSGNTSFSDVPTTHWAAAWIKQLAAEGITGGCGSGNYCPNSSVTRAQMAVFLVRTFNLP